MDRAIQDRKWISKKSLMIAGGLLFALMIVFIYYLASGKSKLDVQTERITISEVRTGAFQESIPVIGVVLPVTTIYLDASEGGRVEEKYVEDGAILKKGTPILRLSNTDLELSLANQETSVFNLLTQMQISKNAARQNTISKLNQMADVENAWREAERLYNMNKKLFDKKAIAAQEFQQSKIAYDYQVKRRKLTAQIMAQDSVSNKQELEQSDQSYDRTRNALAVMRKKVGDLIVRAPVDGQLTSLDAEIGQNKNKGERLGQLDVLSGFKIRAEIDEHYISRIFTGLKGDYTLNDHLYSLKIKKVYTQVSNGHFLVDMEFTGKAAKDVRRGQTLQVKLGLSDAKQSTLIPKGGFYQQTGGNWIFRLSKDGRVAYRTAIKTGGQSLDDYEVLEGLKAGDKVITSGYDNYGTIQELVLNNK
jgi:HlyD family secretion protein